MSGDEPKSAAGDGQAVAPIDVDALLACIPGDGPGLSRDQIHAAYAEHHAAFSDKDFDRALERLHGDQLRSAGRRLQGRRELFYVRVVP